MVKIRNGFVSNSSSSSFIVFKPASIPMQDKEETIKDFFLKEMCYEEDELQEDYFIDIKKEILQKTKDMPGFELVYAEAEYGSEDSIRQLLHNLDIPYVMLD